MKILAIGNFHGKFPSWINKAIKKKKIDLVVSNGDYFPFLYRKLWFKTVYGKDVHFWEVIGKKRYKDITLREVAGGEHAMRGLNSVSVPVYTVLGNFEQGKGGALMDVSDYREERKNSKRYWKWAAQDFFSPILKKCKNIKRFDYKAIRVGEYVLIGMNGHSYPGRVKSKTFKRSRKKLDKLFKKYRKENKNRKVIFVSHIVPYKTRLDLRTSKEADKRAKGRHYGSKLVRRIINTYQPILHIAGHIHERQGKQKLGRTLCVNTGSAHDGNAAIIEIPNKGKVKVRFLK